MKNRTERVRVVHGEAGDRLRQLEELRVRHGFPKETARRVSIWSRSKVQTDRLQLVADLRAELGTVADTVAPQKDGEWPRNRELLDLFAIKLNDFGFSWSVGGRTDKVKNKRTGAEESQTRQWITFSNYPAIGGQALTLADMALVSLPLIDGYADLRVLEIARRGVEGEVVDCLRRMEATGIGYKGLSGVSWLHLTDPLKLPTTVKVMLMATARALFLLFDAVGELFGKDEVLTRLLTHGRPDRIPALMTPGRMDFIRPDIVLATHPETKAWLPVATELESAPAGHGMTHATQVGYKLPTETVDAFVRYLDGRRYLVVATNEWSEYVFEQAAFCRALAERGVEARLIFDRPLDEIHERARTGWHKPSQLDPRLKWDTDFRGRLRKSGLIEFVHGVDRMPGDDGLDDKTVLFRFGYFDNFVNTQLLDRFVRWTERGATIMNPPWFCLESKVLMAAARLPGVQAWIRDRDPEAVQVLHRFLAETRLLADGFVDLEEFERDRAFWLTKSAAWDGHNWSWGARSLQVGAETSEVEWSRSLREWMKLPHPMVAQHCIQSRMFRAPYLDLDGTVKMMEEARSRLTPFFIRQPDGVVDWAGSMITLRKDSFRIHGASDAAEGPVVFTDDEEGGK